jgi:hypothetical protein
LREGISVINKINQEEIKFGTRRTSQI